MVDRSWAKKGREVEKESREAEEKLQTRFIHKVIRIPGLAYRIFLWCNL